MEYCKRAAKNSRSHEIGVIGFLLSCKQAYTEGIDVLCSTNCISIKTEPLLLHLPELLLRDRLASIASLEIVVEAHIYKQENGRFSYSLDHLKPMLDNIARHCCHLRRLCLSFIVEQRHDHYVLNGPALPLIDAFWRSTRLRRMRFDLPDKDYFEIKTPGPLIVHPYEGPIERPFGRSK
jgi:hypothetical protein